MRIAFYNPPATSPIIRRYMCSYNAGENLYPNIELLGLAAFARAHGHLVNYIDCIAEKMNTASGIKAVRTFNADIVLCLCGLECFSDDIKEMLAIKNHLPDIAVGILGYYPSLYPDQCLRQGIDFVLQGEGETGLAAYLKNDFEHPGLYTVNAPTFKKEKQKRLTEKAYNELPPPAHDLILPNLYKELGLGRSLTVAQFTRGCPYACRYCIRTYGRKTIRRSPDKVVEELAAIKKLGIKHVRILDDTFVTDKKWASEICKQIKAKKLSISWSALSRVDTLAFDLLKQMRGAGCKRLYIGIESGSQRVLDFYKKGYIAADIPGRVRQVRQAGIESVGFFLLGAPFENWQDVRLSIKTAKRSDLDFVIVTKLVIYPGTELYDEIGPMAHIDPWSNTHRFMDPARENEVLTWEKRFYREFYTSYNGIRTGLKTFIRDPLKTIRSAGQVLYYATAKRSAGNHPDFL